MSQISYTVDIVMCIDGTGSMGHLIDDVKASALRFHSDLQKVMHEKSKHIHQMRVRIILFRDFAADGNNAFVESPFYILPGQESQFAAFINGIVADGGGDEPENALEALDVAMRSVWTTEGDRKRQIIVMWTDASAHPLEKAYTSNSQYPANMARSFNDLTDRWESGEYINDNAKRLIIYAPGSYPWNIIGNEWSNSIHYESKAGKGLEEFEFNTIIDAIASSI